MRLIQTTTLKFHEFFGENLPKYGILSHTWREEEVSFAEFTLKKATKLRGYQKIKETCVIARRHGLNYVWVDTACIDKSSSAELSEAINSMFTWYKNAQVCFVYLDDVSVVSDLKESRWVTRGWTLQELVAPESVEFYNRSWVAIGTKQTMAGALSRVTKIDHVVLTQRSMMEYVSTATRMSWAASRNTARAEDKAYCLMGMFNVNIPIMYGEGAEKAFIRLQEEILETTNDHSILAWDRRSLAYRIGRFLDQRRYNSFLASDPRFFQNQRIVSLSQEISAFPTLTKRGLRISLPIFQEPHKRDEEVTNEYAILDCRFEGDIDGRIGILLGSWEDDDSAKLFSSTHALVSIETAKLEQAEIRDIYLGRRPSEIFESAWYDLPPDRRVCSVRARSILGCGYQTIHAEPDLGPHSWNPRSQVSEIVVQDPNIGVFREFGFINIGRNEAIVVSFLDFTQEKTKTVALQIETKPAGEDALTWLQSKGLYDATRPSAPNPDWIEGAAVQSMTTDQGDLHTEETSVLVEKRELLSDDFFSSIMVELKHLCNKVNSHIWILELSLTKKSP